MKITTNYAVQTNYNDRAQQPAFGTVYAKNAERLRPFARCIIKAENAKKTNNHVSSCGVPIRELAKQFFLGEANNESNIIIHSFERDRASVRVAIPGSRPIKMKQGERYVNWRIPGAFYIQDDKIYIVNTERNIHLLSLGAYKAFCEIPHLIAAKKFANLHRPQTVSKVKAEQSTAVAILPTAKPSPENDLLKEMSTWQGLRIGENRRKASSK